MRFSSLHGFITFAAIRPIPAFSALTRRETDETFLSHVQPDELLANQLASYLEDNQFDVFIDKRILTV